MNERERVKNELKAIADRYTKGQELYPLAGVLYMICGVLVDGDLGAFLQHIAPFGEQEIQRLRAKNN